MLQEIVFKLRHGLSKNNIIYFVSKFKSRVDDSFLKVKAAKMQILYYNLLAIVFEVVRKENVMV